MIDELQVHICLQASSGTGPKPCLRARPHLPPPACHQGWLPPGPRAVDVPSLKAQRGRQRETVHPLSSLLGTSTGATSGSANQGSAKSLQLPLPSHGAVCLWDSTPGLCRGCTPDSCFWQVSGEPGDANLWQTSEEAISKTAITRKGNKLVLTSDFHTWRIRALQSNQGNVFAKLHYLY